MVMLAYGLNFEGVGWFSDIPYVHRMSENTSGGTYKVVRPKCST